MPHAIIAVMSVWVWAPCVASEQDVAFYVTCVVTQPHLGRLSALILRFMYRMVLLSSRRSFFSRYRIRHSQRAAAAVPVVHEDQSISHKA